MKRQIRFICTGCLLFTFIFVAMGCATAPAPTPTPVPPSSTSIPTITVTKVPPTATAAPSPTVAPKPSVALTTGTTNTSSVSAPAATTAGKETCLACHAFDKLIANSVSYVAPSGEKGSPHRLVPHDSKSAINIPECANCHTAHSLSPLPTAGSINLKQVGVEWCYATCHHQNDFTPCEKCHQK